MPQCTVQQTEYFSIFGVQSEISPRGRIFPPQALPVVPVKNIRTCVWVVRFPNPLPFMAVGEPD